MADSSAEFWRAVIRPEKLQPVQREVRRPTGDLATWAEQVWSLAWDQAMPPMDTALISHPAVQLTVEGGPVGEIRHGHPMPAALLHGVPLDPFRPALPAGGWVVGLHLVSGSVFDLTGIPAHRWTGRVVGWDQAWPGWDLRPVWAAGDPVGRAEAMLDVAQRQVAGREPSEAGLLARRIEQRARHDSSIRRVTDLAVEFALSVRSLQRLCRDHVGVTPRWLVRRARVLDSHELLSTTEREIVDIATALGWFDQAHFTRDYTAVTGTPPARLRRTRASE